MLGASDNSTLRNGKPGSEIGQNEGLSAQTKREIGENEGMSTHNEGMITQTEVLTTQTEGVITQNEGIPPQTEGLSTQTEGVNTQNKSEIDQNGREIDQTEGTSVPTASDHNINPLTTQEISPDIQHAIAGLTNLKNSTRSKLWRQLKNNRDFILSNSHHHLSTIKRKKNFIKEKITNGSIISGRNLPSQLDLNGRKKSSDSLQQQLLVKHFEHKIKVQDETEMARVKFMQQKSLFIHGTTSERRMKSKSGRLKLMTCLKLLKLANRQIKQKIETLQNKMSEKAGGNNNNSSNSNSNSNTSSHSTNTNNNNNNNNNNNINNNNTNNNNNINNNNNNNNSNMELINTIKKVYLLISKHTGIFLPETSRLKIRESLLNLPHRVQATEEEGDGNASFHTSGDTNGAGDESCASRNSKIIVLANETLEVIGKVIEILDETLNKAENWVAESQEDVFIDARSEQVE